MQKEKTLEFWDDFHSRSSSASTRTGCSKEWIACPSQALYRHFSLPPPPPQQHNKDSSSSSAITNVLEIGCGTSCLSRDLYRYYHGTVNVVATDVSAVCIRENMKRDKGLLTDNASSRGGGRLLYQVLNVLEPNDCLVNKNHVILDKGCLDTFLFRSAQRVREQLVRALLDNVHQWLKEGGKYIVVTPRSRIQLLRDYRGFSSVERVVLDETSSTSQIVLGDLDGTSSGNGKRSSIKEQCYLYVCQKDSSFSPGIKSNGAAFRDSYGLSGGIEEDDTCPRCGTSFQTFCGGQQHANKSAGKQWVRRWRGHQIHCKGSNT